MPLTHDLLLVHAATTLLLAGVMWTIQLTIIPRLARATPDTWPHHVRIYRGISRALFWPLVVIEGGSGVGVALLQPAGIPPWLHGINLGLLLCAWITVPVVRYAVGHGPVDRFHPDGFQRFARLNWIRVAVWTGRSVVVLTMLRLAATYQPS
jgi:hypothetical protein